MLGGAKIDGQSIVPDDWIEQATGVQERFGEGYGYGYQWWTFDSGTFQARGIFGQFLAVSPERDLVVVMVSNWPTATGRKRVKRERQNFLYILAKTIEDEVEAP
jgi:CubicO group peptidase (beta-lactamase class C family)